MRFLNLFILILLLSCNNQRKDPRKEILRQFDSVNKSLDQLNRSVAFDNAKDLYDSVAKKYGEDYLRPFILTIGDAKSFLFDLRSRFAWFCGDSTGTMVPASGEGTVDLTNEFFFEDDRDEIFFLQMSGAQQTLMGASKDSLLDEKIRNSLGNPLESSKEKFVRKYFYNTPPVAANTIISKFENDIYTLEREVLLDLLKQTNVPSK